tara:strand:- start:2719 stop:3387 length:669 start_codon:yes stop_codon:yes gene_type:complete
MSFLKHERLNGNGIKINNELVFYPVPKNACTALKREAYFLLKGRDFKTIHFLFGRKFTIHDYMQSNKFNLNSNSYNMVNICNIRNPIERFVSGFQNRVVHYGDLELNRQSVVNAGLEVNPVNINYFVENLEAYMKASPVVYHHFLPQSYFLGEDFSFYNPEMSRDVFKVFESLTGRKVGGYKISSKDEKALIINKLDDCSTKKLDNYYQADFKMYERIYRSF